MSPYPAMSTATPGRGPRLTTVMREEENVTPLELFFDLVFVLALTQCTALMAADPSWEGLGQGLLVLGVLWWSWTGYAWLTSVVNPEEGAVRLVMFTAMAAFLVAALCVPEAFDSLGLLFACAYGVVRWSQIALFVLASRDDPRLRQSVIGLAGGTAVGVGLLIAASFFDGPLQGAVWALALLLDMAEPFFFGSEGWKLMPSHFAERHGLIVIIALGESIVAIGVGADDHASTPVSWPRPCSASPSRPRCGGCTSTWWRWWPRGGCRSAAEGRERNEIARDSYSYLHFPMIAGIVLLALGLKKTLADVEEPLKLVPAVAMLGGTALYLLAHIAFRLRNVHSLNKQRLLVAALLLALVPVGTELPSLATLAILAAPAERADRIRSAPVRGGAGRIRHSAA